MKWLVLWIVVNSYVIECPQIPDPYGFENNTTLGLACWEQESKSMSKEFDNYDELIEFVKTGLDRGIEKFEIYRQVK